MEARMRVDGRSPPFIIGEGSAAEIGKQIAAVYTAWDEQPPSAVDVWKAATEAAGVDEQSVFFKAGRDVAAALDSGEGTGIKGAYHNTTHYFQVLANATHLIIRNNAGANDVIVLSAHEKGKTLFAALTHDFFYEPGGNQDKDGSWVPYRLESISFTNAKPYLEKYGATKSDIDDIRVMLFTTDVTPASKAGSFLRAAHNYLFGRREKPAVTSVLQPVSRILNQPRLARQAAILSDADIMSSTSLSPEYTSAQNAKVENELGRPAGPQNIVNFLQSVAEDQLTTKANRFFYPNMNTIRKTALSAIAAAQDPVTKAPPRALGVVNAL